MSTRLRSQHMPPENNTFTRTSISKHMLKNQVWSSKKKGHLSLPGFMAGWLSFTSISTNPKQAIGSNLFCSEVNSASFAPQKQNFTHINRSYVYAISLCKYPILFASCLSASIVHLRFYDQVSFVCVSITPSTGLLAYSLVSLFPPMTETSVVSLGIHANTCRPT